MKKLSILAIAFAAVVFAACGGKKSEQAEVAADSLKSFEQQQIEASIKMHFDSIAAEIGKLKQLPFLSEGDDGIKLTKEEKQVKPDYLLPVSAAEEATTLAEKYRILSALNVDKKIAALYEMPTEDYDKAITKLVADINDPSFKAIEDANTLFETSNVLYDEMEKNGRINHFSSTSPIRTPTSTSAPSPTRQLLTSHSASSSCSTPSTACQSTIPTSSPLQRLLLPWMCSTLLLLLS